MNNPGGQQPGGNMHGARQGYPGQPQQQQQQQNTQQAGYSNQQGMAQQHQGMQQYPASATYQGRPMQQAGPAANTHPAGWQGYNGAQGGYQAAHYSQQQGGGALPQAARQQQPMHSQQQQQQQQGYPQQQQQTHLQHAAALQQQQQQQALQQHQQALQALQQPNASQQQQMLLIQQIQDANKRARLESAGAGGAAGSAQPSTANPQGLNMGNGAGAASMAPPRPGSAGPITQPQAPPAVSAPGLNSSYQAGGNAQLAALLAQAQAQARPSVPGSMGPPAPVRPRRTEEDQWVLPRRGVQMAMHAAGLDKDYKIEVGPARPAGADASNASKVGSELQAGLLELYSNLIENAVQVGAATARTRKASVLKPRDMALYLESTWGVHVPGFGAPLKPHKRASSSDVHRQRLLAVRNTTQQQDKSGPAPAAPTQDTQQDGNAAAPKA